MLYILSPISVALIVSIGSSTNSANKLNIQKLGRGLAWLDTGTIDNLIENNDDVIVVTPWKINKE